MFYQLLLLFLWQANGEFSVPQFPGPRTFHNHNKRVLANFVLYKVDGAMKHHSGQETACKLFKGN